MLSPRIMWDSSPGKECEVADRVEITVVVDNYIDIFIPSLAVARYPVPGKVSSLWAEQGLSLWVEASQKGKPLKVLYDFGRSDRVLFHNAEILGLDFGELDFLVLSHGHVDHYGCLYEILKRTGEKCKLVIHPEALKRKRFVRLKDGSHAGPWEMSPEILKEFGPRLHLTSEPSDLGFGVHVSGEIERGNDFEKGMAEAFWEKDGRLIHDEIEDDQSLFIELGKRGTIALAGCCHAGAVNTVTAAQNLLPGRSLYALIGGLHLNQADETQMEKTIAHLSQSPMEYFSPLHCTGYHAQRILMEKFRKIWVPSTVGAKITFTA
jgi:7,8-dihydropterin-6-yl-methyl-4-(beta-D-ribofuranosyl)aminobenzene 5'-phosphate synthase